MAFYANANNNEQTYEVHGGSRSLLGERYFVEVPLEAAIGMVSRKTYPGYFDKMEKVFRIALSARTMYGSRLKRFSFRVPDFYSKLYRFHRERAPQYLSRRYGIRTFPNDVYINVSPSERGMELVPVSYVTVILPIRERSLRIMMEENIPFSFVDEDSTE